MARKFKDENCVVVEKRIIPAKEERRFVRNGREEVSPAKPETYRVKILGGVGYTAELGYEDSYLQTVDVEKSKFDLTKINQKVVVSYDYSTNEYGQDKFANVDYEFLNK